MHASVAAQANIVSAKASLASTKSLKTGARVAKVRTRTVSRSRISPGYDANRAYPLDRSLDLDD